MPVQASLTLLWRKPSITHCIQEPPQNGDSVKHLTYLSHQKDKTFGSKVSDVKFVVTQQGAVHARKTKNNPLLKAMQELPPIGFKTYAFSLHCHFLQTLGICPPREGKHLPQLDSFPLPLDKEQSFAKVK